MEIKGVDFQEGDIQLVINGKGVNYGMARSEDVIGRIINFVKLTERTIERKSGKPFRKKEKFQKNLRTIAKLIYLSQGLEALHLLFGLQRISIQPFPDLAALRM